MKTAFNNEQQRHEFMAAFARKDARTASKVLPAAMLNELMEIDKTGPAGGMITEFDAWNDSVFPEMLLHGLIASAARSDGTVSVKLRPFGEKMVKELGRKSFMSDELIKYLKDYKDFADCWQGSIAPALANDHLNRAASHVATMAGHHLINALEVLGGYVPDGRVEIHNEGRIVLVRGEVFIELYGDLLFDVGLIGRDPVNGSNRGMVNVWMMPLAEKVLEIVRNHSYADKEERTIEEILRQNKAMRQFIEENVVGLIGIQNVATEVPKVFGEAINLLRRLDSGDEPGDQP